MRISKAFSSQVVRYRLLSCAPCSCPMASMADALSLPWHASCPEAPIWTGCSVHCTFTATYNWHVSYTSYLTCFFLVMLADGLCLKLRSLPPPSENMTAVYMNVYKQKNTYTFVHSQKACGVWLLLNVAKVTTAPLIWQDVWWELWNKAPYMTQCSSTKWLLLKELLHLS